MAGWRETTGSTGSVAFPLFPESPDAPIVATINAQSKRLAAVTKRLIEATGSGDATTEPEPIELLTINRPAVTGSSLALDAAHRSTHVSATRAAELNHAELFARTAIWTARTASNDMRNQLIQIADTTAGTLHKLDNSTDYWNTKGPPMLDEIDSAAGKVIRVAENTNETMQDAASLVKSILNEWPDSRGPAYTQQMQREQLALIADLMRETPAGSLDGMEPIPDMSPIESFRGSLDKFGGFMIVHELDDPQAALNIASILPLLGPEHGGAKHFAVRMLEPKDQGALDALVNGDFDPLSGLLDRYKRTGPAGVDYNARIEGVKKMLQNAAGAGYQLHAIGGKDRAIGGTVYTAAQESRDIMANRIPEGDKFIVYGDPYETEVGSNRAALDNVLQIPSYEVFHPDVHSFFTPDGDGTKQVPLFDENNGTVWYNVFTVSRFESSGVVPETEYIVKLNPVGF